MSPARSGDRRQAETGAWHVWLVLLSGLVGLGVVAAVVLWLNRRPAPKEAERPQDLVAGQPEAADLRLQKGLALYRNLPKMATHPCGLELVLIPPGKYLMGPPPEEQGLRLPGPGKKPIPIIDQQTHVTLTEPFYLGVQEVTQEQYEAVMGTNPSLVRGPGLPVERVTWEDASPRLVFRSLSVCTNFPPLVQ